MTYNGEKEFLENAAKETEHRGFNIVELSTDKLIGTLGLEHFNWIERSAVLGIFIGDKDFRGQGIGTKMLEFAKKLGKEQNCTDLHLTVNPNNENAIKVYENFGMKIHNLSYMMKL